MPRDFKARIAIGDKDGTRSAVWIVSTANNEVYAAHRTSGGIEKISFHRSGICRRAFTREYGTPKTMNDRVIDRWIRAATQPAGTNSMVRLLSIRFAGGHSMASPTVMSKPAILLDPAVPGRSKNLEVALTNDPAVTVTALIEQSLADISAKVLATHKMPDGETLLLFSCDTEYKLRDLLMPASMHERDDFVFPSAGPAGRTPPIFVTIYATPRTDDGCLTCYELAGFRVSSGQAQVLFPDANQLTRNRVLERQAIRSQTARP